jgi:hypothetical protein
MIARMEQDDYLVLRARLQARAGEWIACGGEWAERGWCLFELLAWIDRLPNPSGNGDHPSSWPLGKAPRPDRASPTAAFRSAELSVR